MASARIGRTIKEFMKDNRVIAICDVDTSFCIQVFEDEWDMGAVLMDWDKLDTYIESIKVLGYEEIDMVPYQPKRRYRSHRTDWDAISKSIGYTLLVLGATAVMYAGTVILAAIR